MCLSSRCADRDDALQPANHTSAVAEAAADRLDRGVRSGAVSDPRTSVLICVSTIDNIYMHARLIPKDQSIPETRLQIVLEGVKVGHLLRIRASIVAA